MKPGSKHTFLFLLTLCFGIFVYAVVKYARPPKANFASERNEEGKDHHQLDPYELFFIDRNYPEFSVQKNLFQRRLVQAIQFDKSQHSSKRGLDYPWKMQGPGNIGGRVNTIAVDPFNSENILLGYSQGGIYLTKNDGENWKAVFDDQASLSISHISFDPKIEGRVYAATGDVNISGYPFIGSGIYRSDDGGNSWTASGLQDKGVLSKVVIDPFESNILYVGSMGYPSHKSDEKGFFKSSDYGQSWSKTLGIDDSTGIIDIAVDPTQPGRLYATSWTRIRTNTYSTTLSPGTSVYRSEDYGETWMNITNGLPGDYHSRTGIEIANDGAVFVSYIGSPTEGECAGRTEVLKGIFRSDDNGMTWDSIQANPDNGVPCGVVGNFGWYFEILKVNPENSNDLFLLGIDMFRSVDGGQTWEKFVPEWWTYQVHADKHDLIFAGDNLLLATDGGAYRVNQNGQPEDWTDIENIPSTQFYRTGYNPHLPDQYFGGAQDNGTTGGNEFFFNEWSRIYGGDGFQPLFDPDEPTWMYGLTQNGHVWYTADGEEFISLNKGFVGDRFWDMPFVMSPHDSKILFAASYVVSKMDMRDTARTWTQISPDLTKGDTILGNRYPAITALAQSALDELRLYAGTQDGKLWTSPDGGLNWIDLSSQTSNQFVTSITTSTVDPMGVFVTYSGYRDNDHTPYIYYSDDAGETWSSLGANIPMLAVNNLLILPGWNDEVLFAATDGGVYVSTDKGFDWDRLGTNLPYMPVYDLEYNPVQNEIVAATFSRGIMTFPVEELDLVSKVDPVSQNSNLAEINVYPTITTDQVIVDFEKHYGAEMNFKISIFNLSGIKVYERQVDIRKTRKINFELDHPNGIYFLLITNKVSSLTKRIIFQR